MFLVFEKQSRVVLCGREMHVLKVGLLRLAWLEIQASEEEEDVDSKGSKAMKAARLVLEGLNAVVQGFNSTHSSQMRSGDRRRQMRLFT